MITIDTRNSNSICGLNWIQKLTWPSKKKNEPMPLNVVDLFCGCGGLTLGVWEATRLAGRNLTVKFAADISEDALKIYRQNFTLDESTARNIDILQLFSGQIGKPPTQSELALINSIEKIDLLIAGPPCQGHSDLNNSTRREDPRNRLYLKVIRAIELFMPKAIIIENVPTIIHDKEKVFYRSCHLLEDLGYTLSSTVINTVDFGLPQKRKRNILVAVKGIKKINLEEYLHSKKTTITPLSEYLSGLEDSSDVEKTIFNTPARMGKVNQERVQYLFQKALYDLPNNLRPLCHKTKTHSYISMYGRLRWDSPSQTITGGFGSMGQGRFIHPTRPRTITPHEAARIQGFPDFFDFSNVKKRTSLQKMIGNAVPPIISALITNYLLEKNIL